ncbi:hypothetical protein C621_0216495 [Bacillus thuringiensis serovar aizawai str. Leapi01]|nr:hypothetical protein C621_0216495 [Bacillus thuringiensis serovar aizawai str. Leapi01]ETE97838.1 hypothetical protein C623_0212335 [Bacillus thuringiensis serovar aizawai str. Hu4-2]OIX18508.1 hypothetical protein BMT18_18295 [Bacillus thuringiensis serovar aizawai]
MSKYSQGQFIFLVTVLISYVSFYLLFLFAFPNFYFLTEFNIRISSLIVETIVVASLLYSILLRKIKIEVFWVCMTFAIGCFLLGNFISIFQVLDIEIPIEHFRMYFCCFSYFFYFLLFFIKL